MDPWALLFTSAMLAGSAFFSASETALFSLTSSQEQRAGGLVQRLLAEKRELLIAVLFSNLVVNLLFFASIDRVFPGESSHLVVGFVALVSILVLGEIVPKTLGLAAPVLVARYTAPIHVVIVGLTMPVRWIMRGLLELFGRLWGTHDKQPHLDPGDLEALFDRIAAGGHLLTAEADLLGEILELSSINVRQIMTPRVDALFVELDGENRDEVVAYAIKKRLARLPVVDETPDRVVGQVRVRDLLVKPDHRVAQLMMPVPFVPEVATALDLLHGLRELRAAEAVVVDEYGGTAGVVTLEDVFEELVGDLRVEGEQREVAVVPIGEGRYRVAGSLSMHDWNDHFGFQVVPKEFETVGGFVTALLGRIPRTGDRATWGPLLFEVDEVRGRRVQWVVTAVAADGDKLEAAPAITGRPVLGPASRRGEEGKP